MDDDPFLRAVFERPDDDHPRLVFADWLEERGDPRGEFIRAQCELARLADDDPRRPALLHRTDRLYQDHGDDWKAPVSAVLGAPASGWFRRGFLESLFVPADIVIDRAEALWAAAPLRELAISELAARTRELAALGALTRLRRLTVDDQRLDLRGLETLLASPHLANLEGLDLSGCALHADAARLLAQGGWPGLTSLSLSGCTGLGDAAARALARSRRLEHLEHLNLVATG